MKTKKIYAKKVQLFKDILKNPKNLTVSYISKKKSRVSKSRVSKSRVSKSKVSKSRVSKSKVSKSRVSKSKVSKSKVSKGIFNNKIFNDISRNSTMLSQIQYSPSTSFIEDIGIIKKENKKTKKKIKNMVKTQLFENKHIEDIGHGVDLLSELVKL